MPQTFQVKSSTLLNLYIQKTRDNSAANQQNGKEVMQHYYTFLASEAKNYSVEKTKYAITKADQRSYLLYPDYLKMKSIRVKNGEAWTPVTECITDWQWHERTEYPHKADRPEVYRLFNDEGAPYFELDPIPSTTGDPEDPNMEITYEGYLDPLQFPADVNTGTVSVVTGGQGVVGVGTAWTSAMIGRFIVIDKYFYEIMTVPSPTSLTIRNYYQESNASGSSYTIAEILRLPAEYHFTPLWGALMDFWQVTDEAKSRSFEAKFARELLMLRSRYQSRSTGSVTPGRRVGSYTSSVPRNYPLRPIG